MKFIEPMAGCLGSYLYLRLGHAEELGLAARNMTTLYPYLSDSWVIAGLYAEASHRGDHKSAYLQALDAGIPILADGLGRLWEAVQRLGLQHPRRGLLDRIVDHLAPQMLWTATTR